MQSILPPRIVTGTVTERLYNLCREDGISKWDTPTVVCALSSRGVQASSIVHCIPGGGDLWLIPMSIHQPLPAQCITASKGLCLALKDVSEKLV